MGHAWPRTPGLGIVSNPRDMPKLKPKRKGGFPRCDLDKFEARHTVGSNARSPWRS